MKTLMKYSFIVVCSQSHVPKTNSCLAIKISTIDKQNPRDALINLIWWVSEIGNHILFWNSKYKIHDPKMRITLVNDSWACIMVEFRLYFEKISNYCITETSCDFPLKIGPILKIWAPWSSVHLFNCQIKNGLVH